MKKNLVLAVFVSMLITALSLPAYSQQGRGPGGPGMGPGQGQGQGMGYGKGRGRRGGRGRGNPFANLNLTEEQRNKLFEIKKEKRSKMHAVKMKSQDLEFKLSEALTGKDFNEGKIKALINQKMDNQKTKMMLKVEFISKVRKILTPEQLKKLNFQALWGRRHGRGGRGGHGRGHGRGRGMGQGQGMGQGY